MAKTAPPAPKTKPPKPPKPPRMDVAMVLGPTAVRVELTARRVRTRKKAVRRVVSRLRAVSAGGRARAAAAYFEDGTLYVEIGAKKGVSATVAIKLDEALIAHGAQFCEHPAAEE